MHPQTENDQQATRHANMPGDDDVGLREIFGAIARRKHVLLITVFGALLTAAIALTQITPLYQAQSFILIEPATAENAVIETAAAGVGGDQEAVKSETYVLTSTALAEQVVRKLGLAEDSEFNAALRSPSTLSQLLNRFGISDALASDRASPSAATLSNELRDSRVIKSFKDALSVAPVDESRVISVQFMAEEAGKAQRIANAIAEQYMALRKQAKVESTRELSGWLDRQIAELRDKVEQGETAVEDLRRRYGLINGNSGNLQSQELAQVNTQLVMARAARAEAEARLNKVSRLKETPDGIQSAGEVLDSALIRSLREEESRLRGTIAELFPELGNKHPRMQRLRAEARELRQKIDDEIGKIGARLQNEVDVARAREASFEEALRDIKERVSGANEKEIELRALEREVEANRALLTNLVNREKETTPQNSSGFLHADARIISRASLPTEAAYPNHNFVLSLTLVASAFLGCLTILLLELLDNGFRSGEQLEAETGAAALGFIPHTKFRGENTEVAHLLKNPATAFAEAIRTLYWSVKLEFGEQNSKVILITSAKPGEGKTTISGCLASTQGSAGKRVLVIDADVRRPALHKRFGDTRSAAGLADYLTGRCDVSQIQNHRSGVAGVTVISAGETAIDAQNQLASDKMEQLLALLRPRYDLIIIDSPPVMVGADSRLLARLADTTVLVVHWGKTQRQVVKLALKRLRSVGTVRVGTVLSRVHARKYSQYAYGDSGAYTGELAKYYGAN